MYCRRWARHLALELIAEGVKTSGQQEFPARYGGYLDQGCLFGKPKPLANFDAPFGAEAT
jgi:sensor c-di-GMP phosphodiesterase-like protein